MGNRDEDVSGELRGKLLRDPTDMQESNLVNDSSPTRRPVVASEKLAHLDSLAFLNAILKFVTR
jgi:protein-disulfide isomerase-like protein with CxxC motif